MWTASKVPVYHYECGMFKLQWDANLSPLKIHTRIHNQTRKKKKTHYSENLPRAKRLFIAQIFNSRWTIVVNKRCSPTTRCFYQSRKRIRTSPRRTTWLFWCTTLTKNVGENKGGNKSHKTGHKIFFLCVCCSSNHMELGERNGLSMLAFFHF